MTLIGKVFLFSSLLAVSACGYTQIDSVKYRAKHNTDVIVEKKVHLMHRQEVINAIEDCKTANLRPILFFSKRFVNDKPIPMVADVTCAPRSGY